LYFSPVSKGPAPTACCRLRDFSADGMLIEAGGPTPPSEYPGTSTEGGRIGSTISGEELHGGEIQRSLQ
jgi:hypothetical protein